MSYVRLDDQHENGRLSEFRSRLSSEVQMQLGEEFSIFQDRNDIAWGQQWQARVDGAIDATTFLIPVITPAFFKSPACRSEVERFLEREKKLGRSDLILPVYYVNCAVFSESLRASDEIAAIIAARQYADWRELRFEPFTTPIVGKTLATLAGQIVRAIELLEPAASLETKTVLPKGGNDPPAELGESEDDSKQVFVSAVQRVAAGAKDPPTIIVDAFHRGDFPTLTEAITAAQPGHRILVRSGLYREALVIDKALEIMGDGELGEVVIEGSANSAIHFRANIGRISNLTIRQVGDRRFHAVKITQGRLDLEGCDITGSRIAGVGIQDGADPRIRRNRIHNCHQSGIFVHKNGLGTIEDNEFVENGHAGVAIATGGNPTVRRNRVHANKESGIHIYDDGLGAIEDNDIFDNRFSGVGIKTNGKPILRGNRIYNNAQSGVYADEKGQGILEGNEITNNRSAGVSIARGAELVVRRNTIQKNEYEAVWIYEGGQGEIVDNDLRENTLGAIDVDEASKPNVKIDGNNTGVENASG